MQGLLEGEETREDRVRAEQLRALGVLLGGTEVEIECEGRGICEEGLCSAR